MEREKVSKNVAAADFVALISDGSTDSAVVEQEMVYVSFCTAGITSVKFLGSVATPKADSEGITESIKKAVDEAVGGSMPFTDFANKLVAMGTDGAAVMTGRNNGVVARVRRQWAPALLGVHCCAHRLELSIADVVKKHPQYAITEKLLLDLWLFYKQRQVSDIKNVWH